MTGIITLPHREGRRWVCSFTQLPSHELSFLAFFGILPDEIGEKEDFEDNKDDEKLDADDEPERATQRHLSETVIVEVNGTAPKAFFGQYQVVRNVGLLGQDV